MGIPNAFKDRNPMEVKVYKIIQVAKGFSIKKPSGEIVNDIVFKTRNEAQRYLDVLMAFNYAKG